MHAILKTSLLITALTWSGASMASAETISLNCPVGNIIIDLDHAAVTGPFGLWQNGVSAGPGCPYYVRITSGAFSFGMDCPNLSTVERYYIDRVSGAFSFQSLSDGGNSVVNGTCERVELMRKF